jgi:hypothetical protein
MRIRFRPRIEDKCAGMAEVSRIPRHDAKSVQNRRGRDEQVRLREGMAQAPALLDEPAPDEKDIFVGIEQPIREQGRSSSVSQTSRRLRDGSPAGSRSMPYLISAMVLLLRNKLPGD